MIKLTADCNTKSAQQCTTGSKLNLCCTKKDQKILNIEPLNLLDYLQLS